MNWLWIPAVVILALFVFVLCWLFFSDYTCCPCQRKRNREPILPTHVDSSVFLPSAPSHQYQPSAPQHYPVTPSDSPHLKLKYVDLPLRQVIKVEQGVLTLDLHGMTVSEATQTTTAFLSHNIGQHHRVKIITGRGMHSENGVPKVKPAIISLLESQNLKFSQIHNGGCLDVVLPLNALY